MQSTHYDAVIIGSGPGGEGAAMKLAKSGKKVAIVEKHSQVGGGCTHWGTIPSKTLRHNVTLLRKLRNNPLIKESSTFEFSDLLKANNTVIHDLVSTRDRHYSRNKIDIIEGHAEFTDDHSVTVTHEEHEVALLTADSFVIATGSRPYRPEGVDFNHPRILDSDTILKLTNTPSSITIYGAGVIGCEYASIFANLDTKVNLVNTQDRLLSFLDDEITDALSYHLRDQGVIIRNNEEMKSIEASDSGVTLHTQSGKQFRSSVVLWANGRSGNCDGMNLDAIGIATNHRGQIGVDENYCTAQPHIYAVGDVAGPPGLASASLDQGRFVGATIANGRTSWQVIEEFPSGIYTIPEISSLGKTERELTAEGVPYEVGQAMFKQIARAQITDSTVGMLKILFHRESLEILGLHCFGETAAEIMHIGQAILRQKGKANTIKYFTETTFNYPTMAEAYRVAALNGLNRLKTPL